ncbi:MAG: hypothetical protein ACK6DU_15950, partial [Planctomycetota bacterium]
MVRTKKKIYALLTAAGGQRLAVTELPSRASSPRPLRMPGRKLPLGRQQAGNLHFGPIRGGQITATGADSMAVASSDANWSDSRPFWQKRRQRISENTRKFLDHPQ